MWFFPAGSRNGDATEASPDLRCVDCVAETAERLANGEIAQDFRTEREARQSEMLDALRPSQISVVPQPRQTSPSKGDRLT